MREQRKVIDFDFRNRNRGINVLSDNPAVLNNTHRVVVEDVNHNHIVLFAGSYGESVSFIAQWQREHVLRPLHKLLLLSIIDVFDGPPPGERVLGKEI